MHLVTLEKYGDGVGKLVLNNPPLNLITVEMAKQIDQLLSVIDEDEEIRVLIIQSSNDKAFSAGSDIREFPAILESVVEDKLKQENLVFNKIAAFSKPTIAMIQGTALGGGCELALACDLRIMAKNAKIALPEIKLGWFPGSGGLYRLPQLVGPAIAKELMFLGEFLSAEDALRIGLVNRIVEPEILVQITEEIALEIASRSLTALKAIKFGVNQSLFISFNQMIDLNLELCKNVFRAEDAVEGIQAFFAKRKPQFNKGGNKNDSVK